MVELGVPGFFGKLPSRGDFVSRRLPPEFISAWDRWLQDGVSASRSELADRWLDVYLTSPIWSFVLSAGICGDSGYAGVMIPSVDKVGRYFPLVATMSCGRRAPLVVRQGLGDWFSQTQELMLETLADPPLDADEFDSRLATLNVALPGTALDWESPATLDDSRSAWRFLGADASGAEDLNAALLSKLLSRGELPVSVWWTEGSDRVGDCTLFVPGLPTATSYRAMLDGDFDSDGWSRGVLRRERPSAAPTRWLTSSAARSDPGKVRPLNEDSFACFDEAGIWIVADGLGGHRAGEVASRMVTSIAAGVPPSGTLAERVECLARGAHVVNGCLRVFAEGLEAATVASTMAALVVVGSKMAALWVGDSRVYRLRAGRLEQLTRDHAEEDAMDSLVSSGGPHNRAVTRAVGGSDDLDIDAVYEAVQPDDRYLLCTDGLYTMTNEAEIMRALSLSSVEHACEELARIALEGPASDNLTAVVVQITRVAISAG